MVEHVSSSQIIWANSYVIITSFMLWGSDLMTGDVIWFTPLTWKTRKQHPGWVILEKESKEEVTMPVTI